MSKWHMIMNIKQPCIAHDYLKGGGDLTDGDCGIWWAEVIYDKIAATEYTNQLTQEIMSSFVNMKSRNVKYCFFF